MRILLLDNYDSFTYNLFQQIERLGGDVEVRKHDQVTIDEIWRGRFNGVVLSPGPKTPADSGISCEVISEFYRYLPILGVCLGMQCIGEVFRAKTVHAPEVMHGKTSEIEHDSSGIFQGAPNPMTAARYHSLVIDRVPDKFRKTAWVDDVIMGIQHEKYPVFGVQFHPESFLTPEGDILIKNFLNGSY